MTSPEDKDLSRQAGPAATAGGWVARLRARPGLVSVLANSGWLMAEQVLRLGIGFVLGVWTARHVGPADFGLLSYAAAYTAVFAAVGTMGLNRVLVRELVSSESDPSATSRLMSTAFTIRLTAAVFLYVIALAGAAFGTDRAFVIVALISASLVFSMSDTIDLFFMSRVQSRRVAKMKMLSLLAGACSRTFMLVMDAPVFAFAAITLLESALTALLVQVAYRRAGMRIRISDFEWDRARSLMRECSPEILAALSINLFMRLDQIMLQHLTEPAVVGTFAVAARLTELWYFVPVAIVNSTFPGIVALRASNHDAYMGRLELLTGALVSFGYVAVLITWLVVSPLVPRVFGAAYEESALILLIQVWSVIFMVMGQTSGAWLMAERKAVLNLYRGLFGLAVNLSAGFALIPHLQGRGAALSTLISIFSAYFLFDFLHPATREIGWLKLRALVQWPVYVRRNAS